MTRFVLAPLVFLTLLGCKPDAAPSTPAETTAATPAAAATPGVPQTEEEKTFYALGLSLGHSIEVFKLTPAELAMVQAGLHDQVTGATPQCDIQVYGPKLGDMAQARQGAASAEEKVKAAEFLATAAAAPGAEKLPSGVIFLPGTPGTGAAPTPADVVKVHYRGTLRDGSEFDSSYKRNEPATFPLDGVIPCWTEGLQKLKVGGKGTLTCPSDQAYGDQGSPPVIPGGAALQFEVELVEILPRPL